MVETITSPITADDVERARKIVYMQYGKHDEYGDFTGGKPVLVYEVMRLKNYDGTPRTSVKAYYLMGKYANGGVMYYTPERAAKVINAALNMNYKDMKIKLYPKNNKMKGRMVKPNTLRQLKNSVRRMF